MIQIRIKSRIPLVILYVVYLMQKTLEYSGFIINMTKYIFDDIITVEY